MKYFHVDKFYDSWQQWFSVFFLSKPRQELFKVNKIIFSNLCVDEQIGVNLDQFCKTLITHNMKFLARITYFVLLTLLLYCQIYKLPIQCNIFFNPLTARIFTVFEQSFRRQSVTQRSMDREASTYPPQYLGP